MRCVYVRKQLLCGVYVVCLIYLFVCMWQLHPAGVLHQVAALTINRVLTCLPWCCLQALAVGLGLLRIIPLVIFIIRSKLAGTERAKYRVWAKQTLTFGTYVATHTMTILLGLCFCCLSPLIAPFCLLYFTLAILAQKYQLVYVFSHPYEACGRLWISVSAALGRSTWLCCHA